MLRLRETDAIEAPAAARGDRIAFCHNDFYRFNVITDAGRLTVLDCEICGVGNVYFDLATPAFHEAYPIELERLLLETYFDEPADEHLPALRDFKYLNIAREVAWGLLHAGIDAAQPDAGHVNHALDYRGSALYLLRRLLAGHVTT